MVEAPNRLLSLLSDADQARLRPLLQPVQLHLRESLYESNTPIRFVWFIQTGVASLVKTLKNGDSAEVSTIGNEGMIGFPLLLGERLTPNEAYIQVPGFGLRMTSVKFVELMQNSASMQKVMLRYAHALFGQVAQSIACIRFHTLRQRTCRWLLMTHDRMATDEFLLTQEFLAMMLSVQRTGVTTAASTLRRAGLIRYSRGLVTIIDRAGLERETCECYGTAKREFDRLLGVSDYVP